MKSNCYFSNAYKNSSSLENYLTESFVFVLKYLIDSFPLDAISILNLFGIKITDTSQLKDIKLESQKTFYAPNEFCDENKIPIENKKRKDARPDIVIYQSKNPTIIEVKVEACLNSYKLKNRAPIDQIDFYENIKGIKAVYTLSKHFIDKNNFSNKVRWFQIYEKLNNNKSFVVKEFCDFLNENNMGEREKLNNESIIDFYNSVAALPSLIKEAWNESNLKLALEGDTSIGTIEIGKYGEKTRFFVGLSKTENEIYKDAILFLDRYPLNMESFEKFDDEWFVLKDVIKIEKLFDLKSGEAQLEMLADWLKNKVAPVL